MSFSQAQLSRAMYDEEKKNLKPVRPWVPYKFQVTFRGTLVIGERVMDAREGCV
jgi:hypothetical protein